MVSLVLRNIVPLGLALALLPLAGDIWVYQVSLYLTYAIATTGLGMAWGLTGILSLGHGLYMAAGAYLAANAFMAVDGSAWAWPLAFLCALVPMMIAFVIAMAVFRGQTGTTTSFSMITLALALAGGQLAISWPQFTGGFNGLLGIPSLPGVNDILPQYLLVATATLLVCFGYAWLAASPLGTVMRAIAQDERRLQFFGYNTAFLKALAFALSGLCAGIAGTIYAQQQNIVTPDLTSFAFCGSLLLFAAVGGRFSVLGPLLGALLVGLLGAELRDRIDWWELVLAVIFILVVLKFPKGIGGWVPVGRNREAERKRITAPNLRGPKEALSCSIDSVQVQMGPVKILNGLDFRADAGATTCIIGPNGAGKSSAFNTLTGLLPIRSGGVALDDTKIGKPSPRLLTRSGVSRKFQAPTVFTALTVRENILLALWSKRANTAKLLQRSPWHWTNDLLRELESRFPFLAQGDQLASDLSHGQRQILELAMVLLTEPRMLLLDEPCAGLSQGETSAVVDLIKWVRSVTRMTIIIVEHDMGLVQALADVVNVFHQGRFLAKGTIEEVRANALVQSVYSGGHR